VGTLVDSSVLIRLERASQGVLKAGRPADALTKLAAAFPEQEEVGMATITASELLHGVHRASPEVRPRRAAFVEMALMAFPPLAFDLHVARVHAAIWAELQARHTVIGPHDLIIAATAVAAGWKVATLNGREFSRVPGLSVVAPDLGPSN
jgi:tRNA(fMet)-specific endonuclease VapC